MFRRNKLPRFLANKQGRMPLAASPVVGGGWLAAWPTLLAVVPETGERAEHLWSDFEAGSWDDDADQLTLSFVDPRIEPIRLTLPRDADPLIITMIRERIDRSIVFTQVAELPSGLVARGQVRRNPDESLFTQIIVDGDASQADLEALNGLETQLREAVGLE